MTRLIAASLVCGAGLVAVAAATGTTACPDCVVSRYWSIDPDTWKSDTLVKFPETDELNKMRPDDLGIAFSGGGTRSAAATLGELRGLRDSGWLGKVRYISAVSGGSWAAVPYVYSPLDLDELLGAPEAPRDLTLDALTKKAKARGKLGEAIAKSSLVPGASIEAGDRIASERLDGVYKKIASFTFARLKGSDAARDDKTFSRLLDRIFIKPLISDPLAAGSDAPPLFSWTDASVADIASINREMRGVARINPARFAVTAREPTSNSGAVVHRPFLIALGTVVVKDAGGGYPRLAPVEYTPLYAGVRQQLGDHIGGTYVSPFAYDAAQVIFEREDPGGGRTGVVAVGPAGSTSTFSLADVIGSSGAAPQLHLLVDKLDPKADPMLRKFADFFPNYRNVAVRIGPNHTAGATDALPHGDGGFVDNLGLLPLLARHVKNVVVFVNGLMGHRLETMLPSYFWPTGEPDGGGTRRLNAVFDADHWPELIQGLDRVRDAGLPQVYCSDPERPWKVHGNEFYNVQPYAVNICWVYIADSDKPAGTPGESQWRKDLRDDVRFALFGRIVNGKKVKGQYEGDFKRFPWFRTFGENIPTVVDMKTRQVNVLANFTSWMVTHEETQRLFSKTFLISPEPRK